MTEGQVREHIAAFGPDDADSIDVWTIYQDKRLTKRVTGEFADAIGKLTDRRVHHLKLARSH